MIPKGHWKGGGAIRTRGGDAVGLWRSQESWTAPTYTGLGPLFFFKRRRPRKLTGYNLHPKLAATAKQYRAMAGSRPKTKLVLPLLKLVVGSSGISTQNIQKYVLEGDDGSAEKFRKARMTRCQLVSVTVRCSQLAARPKE
jgi:hypothetical protein